MDHRQSLKLLRDLKGSPDQKDILFKMSKKIAQLTKVIYFLNTRNEDFDAKWKHLIVSHEQEMKEMEKKDGEIIAELNQKVAEALQRSELQDNVIKHNLKTIAELEATIKDNSIAIGKISQEVAKKVAIAESKIRESAQENAALSEKVVSIKDLAETEKFNQLEALRLEHAKEIMEIYQSNLTEVEKLKSAMVELEAEKSDKILQLQKAAETREIEIRDELEKKLSGMRFLSDSLKSKESELQNLCKSLSEDLQESARSIEALETEKFNHEQVIASQIQEMKEKDQKYDILKSEVDIINESLTKYKEKYPELQERYAILEFNYKSILTQKEELDQNLVARENDLSETKAALLNSQQSLTEVGLEIEPLKNIQESLESALKTANEKISKLKLQIVHNQESAERILTQKLADLQSNLDRIRNEELEKQTKRAVKEKNDIIAANVIETEKLHATLNVVKINHAKSLEEERARFSEHDRSLKSEISDLKLSLNNARSDLQSLTDECETRVKTINSQISTIKQKEAAIKKLETELVVLYQKMIQNEENVRQELQERFKEEKLELDSNWENKVRNELLSQKKLMDDAKERSIKEYEKKLRFDFDQELAVVHADFTKTIAATTAALSEKNAEIQLLDERIRILEAKNQSSANEIKTVKETHMKNIETKNEEFQRKLLSMEQDYITKTDQLRNGFEAKNAQTQAENLLAHKKQMDSLRLFHSGVVANMKKEFALLKSKELDELQSKHKTLISIMEKEHEEKIKENLALSAAEKDLLLKQLEEELCSKLNNTTVKYEKCKSDLEKLSTAYNKLRFDHDSLSAALEKNRVQLNLKEKEFKKASKEHEDKVNIMMFEFNSQLRGDREKLQFEHLDELQAMLQEFERARDFLKQEISHRDKMLRDAEEKYINRESRAEDVKKMSDMATELDSLNAINLDLKKQLSHYSLELKNREVSFNKIFNNIPVIAPAQPLKQKLKQKQKPAHSIIGIDSRSKSINF